MPKLKTNAELSEIARRIIANGPSGLESPQDAFQALAVCIELLRRNRENLLSVEQHSVAESLFSLCSESSRLRNEILRSRAAPELP
jgi:hypothetical protein